MEKLLQYLVLHCTATPEGRNIKADDVIAWHTAAPPVGFGWRRPGYSNIVELDGTLVNIRHYNNDGWVQADERTNGARGYNDISRHICYVGGLDKYGKPKDTRTAMQLETLEKYCIATRLGHPHVEIIGHHDLNPGKACPGFDVKKWFADVWEAYERNVGLGSIGNLDPKTERRI